MSVFFRLAITSLAVFFSCSSVAGEMTFDILYMNQTNVVVADGEITSDTPKHFREFLATDPFDGYIYVVALNSPGGSLLGGLGLGRLFRSQGLSTAVLKYRKNPASGDPIHESEEEGSCYSACALAFLGGKQRVLIPLSKLGFHQFSSARGSLDAQDSVMISETRSQLLGAKMLNYIVDMGINPLLYSTLSETLPFNMYIPESKELRSLNITTKTAFQEFGFEPYGRGVIAYATFPENVVGRQYVSQITTYCKGGIPYLLLSKPQVDSSDSDVAKNLMEHQNGFSIKSEEGGVEYGPDSVKLRTGGLPIAEIRLDPQGARLLATKSQGRIDVGGMFGIFSFQVDPSRADVKKIQASFRHCIS